ncbi:UPF0175 family protein [Prochlorothrix hollandica]|uniref:Uncharacterized protein n=1 Tax=Prochlorothrix hollandica PCC 9006 = CALU 1027 TaxID=317619 RepID=A0A0M2PZ98_PROHO|nr:UPF0175 family protein [Prochlorothrix hollandica]KKJ00019.1 hypothetical protein PROH_09595 [Prochlorothrix hollandica PCC 9006 = CALU 1027]
MQITIEFPDTLPPQLIPPPLHLSRRILELLIADQYRQGHLSAAQVRQYLGFSSRWQTYEFLKTEQAYIPYHQDTLEQDSQTLNQVLGTP